MESATIFSSPYTTVFEHLLLIQVMKLTCQNYEFHYLIMSFNSNVSIQSQFVLSSIVTKYSSKCLKFTLLLFNLPC